MTAHREIERKFLVLDETWRDQVVGEPVVMRAGYVSRRKQASIRVRFEGEAAILTLKGLAIDPEGRERPEFNFPIPADQGAAILDSGMVDGGVIRKVRYTVQVGASLFEVDEFEHPRPGLVLAEIELPSADADFERPDWLGEEVTADSRYSNAVIAGEA
ncbi:CYTH domain-containing protein [Caulobacter sp. NIBR1757]|uniref:CYTH domain-containing protein n=1 Tax=Caulobacter sp. NIBR1757 TaxID=3016000 RepID=UPI0022F10D9F|nr:CYTH domain-containing protein [Caulobacter sp. NIBR1757]WGM38487.1 Inorganic triphosphatase [Caulobacter sp. NIBR1757]